MNGVVLTMRCRMNLILSTINTCMREDYRRVYVSVFLSEEVLARNKLQGSNSRNKFPGVNPEMPSRSRSSPLGNDPRYNTSSATDDTETPRSPTDSTPMPPKDCPWNQSTQLTALHLPPREVMICANVQAYSLNKFNE